MFARLAAATLLLFSVQESSPAELAKKIIELSVRAGNLSRAPLEQLDSVRALYAPSCFEEIRRELERRREAVVRISPKGGSPMRVEAEIETAGRRTVRVFEFEGEERIRAARSEGEPWPSIPVAGPDPEAGKPTDASSPRKVVESLLAVRRALAIQIASIGAEIARRFVSPEAYAGEGDREELESGWGKRQGSAKVLDEDPDRRFALVYVSIPTREGERAVRVRLVRPRDEWRIAAEEAFCADCPEQSACKLCQGTGIMKVGDEEDPHRVRCTSCRPAPDCPTCGGAGYHFIGPVLLPIPLP